MKLTSDFLSVFSCVGMLKKNSIHCLFYEQTKPYRSVILVFEAKKDTDGGGGAGILVCCVTE